MVNALPWNTPRPTHRWVQKKKKKKKKILLQTSRLFLDVDLAQQTGRIDLKPKAGQPAGSVHRGECSGLVYDWYSQSLRQVLKLPTAPGVYRQLLTYKYRAISSSRQDESPEEVGVHFEAQIALCSSHIAKFNSGIRQTRSQLPGSPASSQTLKCAFTTPHLVRQRAVPAT